MTVGGGIVARVTVLEDGGYPVPKASYAAVLVGAGAFGAVDADAGEF